MIMHINGLHLMVKFVNVKLEKNFFICLKHIYKILDIYIINSK